MSSCKPVATTIGVDLGGTKLLAGAVEADGRVRATVRRRIAGLPLEAVVEVAVAAVGELDGDGAAAVGFGIPALIDARTRVAVRSVHLPLDGVGFEALLSERLGRPVAVDNDGNCALLAEWRAGAARGCEHAALLALGTGIGGGLLLGGAIYRGSTGAGAELGHMPVDLDGPPCFGGCPGRGCLEALCSGSALARDAHEAAALLPDTRLGRDLAAGVTLTGERVTELAREGDPDARGLLQRLGTRLGAGIAGIAMALNPQIVIVGGGVLAAGELVLGPAREEVARRAMEPSRSVRIEPTAFGDAAGMIGAALLVREAA